MTSHKRTKSLLWLLAGWLFIAPLLGFQHLYSAHSPLADDVCETCLLSSGGGQALVPHVATTPQITLICFCCVATEQAPQQAVFHRANARAPPIA